uniref:Uncharacterized protein n=12 Tax=Spermatophyta TaxID=58024 RepID=A0A6N2MX22_SALVM
MQKAIESSRARANPRKSYSKVKGNKMPNPGKLGAKAYQFPSKGNKGGHQTNSSLNGNSLRMPQDRISKSTSDWIPRGWTNQLLWGTKDEIQSIPPFKWFSLLLVPVPNSSPGSSQCLALSILRGCNINKFAHDQVPVIVIRLPEPRGLSVETSTNNRRFLIVFPLLTAALFTPPDIWCQIVARFLISLIIELAIFVASIVQVREEIITHRRLLTVSLRSGMSDASGKRRFREARRAKPLMSWRRLYLRKSAKKLRFHMCYILSIERELLRTAFIPFLRRYSMGLPWYRVHTVVLNDPGRLLAVHIMHTALVAAVFDPSDPVLDPMWRQGMFVIPFMTRLGITNSWGGWSITGGTITNPGIWSYEGVAGAHIVFSGLCFLAAIWHWVYWDLEIFCDERTGKPSLDLPKIFGIHLFLSGVACFGIVWSWNMVSDPYGLTGTICKSSVGCQRLGFSETFQDRRNRRQRQDSGSHSSLFNKIGLEYATSYLQVVHRSVGPDSFPVEEKSPSLYKYKDIKNIEKGKEPALSLEVVSLAHVYTQFKAAPEEVGPTAPWLEAKLAAPLSTEQRHIHRAQRTDWVKSPTWFSVGRNSQRSDLSQGKTAATFVDRPTEDLVFVKHGERSHVSAGSCASIHWAFVLDFLSGAVLSAAFLSSLAAGAREGADMVSNPDERDDWCYIYPYLLFLITHSVDYIQLRTTRTIDDPRASRLKCGIGCSKPSRDWEQSRYNSALTAGAVTQSFLVLAKSARVLNLVEFSAGRIRAGVQTCSGDGPKPDKGDINACRAGRRRPWAEWALAIPTLRMSTTSGLDSSSSLAMASFSWRLDEGQDIGKVLLLFSRSYVLNYDSYWSEKSSRRTLTWKWKTESQSLETKGLKDQEAVSTLGLGTSVPLAANSTLLSSAHLLIFNETSSIVAFIELVLVAYFDESETPPYLPITSGLIPVSGSNSSNTRNVSASYRALLGRPWIHNNYVVPSTFHQCFKYKADGDIYIYIHTPVRKKENRSLRVVLSGLQNRLKDPYWGSDSGSDDDEVLPKPSPPSQSQPKLPERVTAPLTKVQVSNVENLKTFVVKPRNKGQKGILYYKSSPQPLSHDDINIEEEHVTSSQTSYNGGSKSSVEARSRSSNREGKARRALSIVVETMPFPLDSKAPLSSLPSCFLTTTTYCLYHPERTRAFTHPNGVEPSLPFLGSLHLLDSFSFDPFPKRRRGIGRSLLTLDRGATLIAYGSYLARLALDYLRILTSIADWRYTDSYSRLHRLMLAFLLIPSL